MSKHLFTGTPRQIGRHGHLQKGDVVEFDDAEEAYLKANPHKEFSKLDAADVDKAEAAMRDRQAKAETAASKLRQQQIEADAKKAADENPPQADGLDDLAPAELLDIVDQLNEKGAAIRVRPNTPREKIIAAIREAREKNPPPQVSDE
jgi:hypothetical protein